MVVGPEGNIWFTEEIANRIGYITPAGHVTQLAELSPGALTGSPSGRTRICGSPRSVGAGSGG